MPEVMESRSKLTKDDWPEFPRVCEICGVDPGFISVVNATGPQPLADQMEYSKEVCRRTQVVYRYVRSGYC